jgi:hypothetical protein
MNEETDAYVPYILKIRVSNDEYVVGTVATQGVQGGYLYVVDNGKDTIIDESRREIVIAAGVDLQQAAGKLRKKRLAHLKTAVVLAGGALILRRLLVESKCHLSLSFGR